MRACVFTGSLCVHNAFYATVTDGCQAGEAHVAPAGASLTERRSGAAAGAGARARGSGSSSSSSSSGSERSGGSSGGAAAGRTWSSRGRGE